MGEAEGTYPRAWPRFLQGRTPEEVLAKLRDSDPLHLVERTARRLRDTWVLLEPDRVVHRALAVIAMSAVQDDPPANLDEWVLRKVDVAIERLVRLDQEAERVRPETLTEEEANFPLLTETAMLEPELVRKVSVAFNALPPLPRRAFFELLIEGLEVPACIERGPWDEDGLYEAIQQALACFELDYRPDPRQRSPARNEENR